MIRVVPEACTHYFARVKGGKVVEFNSYPDMAGMMMQLGFMPQM